METLSVSHFNGDEKILLVDDEKALLIMMEQLLKRFGYDVRAYDKSKDALSGFESSPYEYDIVITDMTMPAISGDKLAAQIKAIRPEIPVILFTGFDEKTVAGRVNGSKPDKVLMKPSGKDEILKNIRMLLDR